QSPPTELFTLSLHDALPIFRREEVDGLLAEERIDRLQQALDLLQPSRLFAVDGPSGGDGLEQLVLAADSYQGLVGLAQLGEVVRSEEHTSELQSRFDLVCRL